MKNRNDWLAGLSVGDEVLVTDSGYDAKQRSARVVRTTGSRIILAHPDTGEEWRFRRADGREIVASTDEHVWPHSIYKMPPGGMETVERTDLVHRVRRAVEARGIRDTPNETLREVVRLLERREG